jgi:SH3 domain-containing YSC84-like protein 1
MHITKRVAASMTVTALLIATAAFAADSKSDAKRLNRAAAVLTDLRNAPDNGIPDRIWSKAECVVVIPSLKKAGFIVGGESGSGVMSCRQGNHWGAPVFMELTKGSVGLQAGVSSTELVLLVMNRSGIEKLLSNKVTLGADASVAAGPVGRSASTATDAQMTAEMLAYSRSKGLFAGIDLSGGSLNPDESANASAYGPNVSAREIALGTRQVQMSSEARAFTDALGRGVAATTGVK